MLARSPQRAEKQHTFSVCMCARVTCLSGSVNETQLGFLFETLFLLVCSCRRSFTPTSTAPVPPSYHSTHTANTTSCTVPYVMVGDIQSGAAYDSSTVSCGILQCSTWVPDGAPTPAPLPTRTCWNSSSVGPAGPCSGVHTVASRTYTGSAACANSSQKVYLHVRSTHIHTPNMDTRGHDMKQSG